MSVCWRGGEDVQRVQTPVPAVAAADSPSQPCVTEQKTEAPGDRDAGRGERSSRDAFLALDSFNEEDMTASVEGPMGDHTMTGAPDPKASSKQLLLR